MSTIIASDLTYDRKTQVLRRKNFVTTKFGGPHGKWQMGPGSSAQLDKIGARTSMLTITTPGGEVIVAKVPPSDRQRKYAAQMVGEINEGAAHGPTDWRTKIHQAAEEEKAREAELDKHYADPGAAPLTKPPSFKEAMANPGSVDFEFIPDANDYKYKNGVLSRGRMAPSGIGGPHGKWQMGPGSQVTIQRAGLDKFRILIVTPEGVNLKGKASGKRAQAIVEELRDRIMHDATEGVQ